MHFQIKNILKNKHLPVLQHPLGTKESKTSKQKRFDKHIGI
jgi:hypothetical protein